MKFECQICAGMFTAKAGLLVKHGYKRPGDGFLHGECYGVGHVDYATGVDALRKYRALILNMLTDARAFLAKLDGAAPVFTRFSTDYARDEHGRIVYKGRKYQMVPVVTEMVPGVTDRYTYESALKSERFARETRVSQLEAEVSRVDTRIAASRAVNYADYSDVKA